MNSTIKIKEDFSNYPALRHCSVSENSGEDFYHKVLNSKFKIAYDEKTKLTVILDGTDGYAPSFLDEAFGNLVYDFSLSVVKMYIDIISNEEPYWKKMIESETFSKWEERRIKGDTPKVTVEHSPWYRLENNIIEKKIWEKPTK